MKWILKLFRIKPQNKKTPQQDDEILDDVFVPSINLDGSFIKADLFEELWINQNVKHLKMAKYSLNDDDYIDYKIWEDQYFWKLHYNHLPNKNVLRGDNNIIVFHGGCLGCKTQEINTVYACKGCKYFKFTDKPDLSIHD
jgi:hypothetical protein